MKLLYFVTEARYFISHRLSLAQAAQAAGFEVAVVCKLQGLGGELEDLGFTVFDLSSMERASLNPVKALRTLWQVCGFYQIFKPTIVHHIALKPILMGSFACLFLARPRVINALNGLGFIYTKDSHGSKNFLQKYRQKVLRYLVSHLLQLTLFAKKTSLLLQNTDDLQELIQCGVSKARQAKIIRGSGIDIAHFAFKPEATPPYRVILVARLLWDKGIGEFIAALKILKQGPHHFEAQLYGQLDTENPAGIAETQIRAWERENLIKYMGAECDIANAYANCHIAVLPSYREGLPKSLLEAASIGRPIVSCDVPGCREIVIHNYNGFLVPARDAQQLAVAIAQLLENEPLRHRFGRAGRTLVETYFDEKIIHRQMLALYQSAWH